MPWTFDFTYPGVTSVYSVQYLTSLGISPGVLQVDCHPTSAPALAGTAAFGVTDGVTTKAIILPGCLLLSPEGQSDAGGRVLTLRLLDRRWSWTDRYPFDDGHHNQQDKHRKLIPSTVRSPYQLAVMCLNRMGETPPGGGWESVIDLPAGLASPADGPLGIPAPASFDTVVDAVDDFLRCGTNFTRSRTNPMVNWLATPAAVALAQLCEQYGRAVCLDPLTNQVSIVRLGVGSPLPEGRRLNDTVALSLDAVPSAVTAMGSPTRYQLRAALRAVGKDWDGDWKPLDQLSYAPELPPGQAMRSTCRPDPYASGVTYKLYVNGVRFEAAVHASAADVVTTLVGAVNASVDPRVAGRVGAGTVVGPKVQLTAIDFNGSEFDVRGEPADHWTLDPIVGPIPDAAPQIHRWAVDFTDTGFLPADTLVVTVNGTPYKSTPGGTLDEAVAELADLISGPGTGAKAAASGTSLNVNGITPGTPTPVTAVAAPPGAAAVTLTEVRPPTTASYGFQLQGRSGNARATERMRFQDAQAAVQDTVFRCYQVVCQNPADPADKTIPVPSLLAVARRYLLVLLGTMVEQVEPRPGDATAIDPSTGQPYAADVYTGYSADRDPAVYASVHTTCLGGLGYRVKGALTPHTDARQRVYTPFRVVDPERMVIQFDRPLFRVYGQGTGSVWLPAKPVIEIGVFVLDPATNAPRRYAVTVAVPGATAPPVTRVFEDVQQEVIGEYDADHTLVGFHVNDADPEFRATTYATETALKYQAVGARTFTYNSLEPLALDGLVRQIGWRFDASGFLTTASENSEFSRVVPPYGERRRAENLPPDAQQSLENLMTNPVYRGRMLNAASLAGPAAAAFGGPR